MVQVSANTVLLLYLSTVRLNFIGTLFLSKQPSHNKNENDFVKFQKLIKNYLLTLSLYLFDEFMDSGVNRKNNLS